MLIGIEAVNRKSPKRKTKKFVESEGSVKKNRFIIRETTEGKLGGKGVIYELIIIENGMFYNI